MKLMTSRMWAYIARRFMFNALLVLTVICGIVFAVECIENLRRASNADKAADIVFVLSFLRLPWLVDGEPLAWTAPAPTLGQHTREVLRDLGFSDARIAAFIASGAAREA